MNYYQFVQKLAEYTDTLKADVNPTIMVPAAIDYAEQRIYRDLDLLATRVVDSSTIVTSGSRTFNLPGTYVVVETVNVSTPASVAFSSGTRNSLMPVTKQFLDITYPSASVATGIPLYYAMQTNSQIILGPVPDHSYPIEITGTQRPSPLSSANSSTILTTAFPDLFTYAALVGVGDYIRREGKGTPPETERWEAQYKTLLQSAIVEEARKKYAAEGWTMAQPSPIATPPRV